MARITKVDALENAINNIHKTYGVGSIMKLGDKPIMKVPVISTGSISLDIATGIGGLPKARVLEIYGPESSGKTTLTLAAIAQAQKAGGIAAFIDVEHALDPEHAKRLGVNIEDLLISQPGTGEEALEIAEHLTRSGAVDIIVIDSVAALVPRAEIEGSMGDAHVGLQARLMSQALRKLTGVVAKSGTLVIFINQIREKIGVMFGNPETTSGGRALKFYASMRLEIRRGETLKNGTDIIGNVVKVKVVKNKVAPPFKTSTFDIIYSEGISKEADVLDMGVKYEVVKRAGTWFSYGETRLGQGRENSRIFLKEHSEIYDEIREKIMNLTFNKKEEEPNDLPPKTENNPVKKKIASQKA